MNSINQKLMEEVRSVKMKLRISEKSASDAHQASQNLTMKTMTENE